MDRIEQILVPEGLGKKFNRTGFHGLHRHRNISMTGDKNNRNSDAGINQLMLKVQTVDSGKSHVQNQATWRIRALTAEEFLRCSEGFRTQANRLEHAMDGGTHQVIVIDD